MFFSFLWWKHYNYCHTWLVNVQRRLGSFALVVNYINKKWKPGHIIVGIFEVHETLRATMVIQSNDLFVHYDLLDKVIAYVKDEGANLNTFTITLSRIISCVPLLWPQPYVTSCYEYAMSKCCQYPINHLKVWHGMKEASIKMAISLFF